VSYLLGMLGPLNLADFRKYLYPDSWRDDLPKGLGGTPVNLLSCELLNRGHRLVIFTLDPAVQDEIVLEGINLRICIGPFRPRAKHRALDFFAVERDYLLRAIKRERPDILHAQWTYEYALAAQASGLPHVITAHDATHQHSPAQLHHLSYCENIDGLSRVNTGTQGSVSISLCAGAFAPFHVVQRYR